MPDNFGDRMLFAAKAEGTYGQDAFSGSDPSSWLAMIEQESPPFSDEVERKQAGVMSLTHDVRRFDHYGDRIEVEGLTLPLKTATTAVDDPPPDEALYQAANLKTAKRDPDSSAASGDEYWEAFPYTGDGMTNVPSATLALYLFNSDYTKHAKWLAKGYRGNLTWTFVDGEIATLGLADGLALYEKQPTPTTSSSLQPSAYSANERNFILKNGTFKYNSTTYPVAGFELSTNWSVNRDDDGTQSTGTLAKVSLNRRSDAPPAGSFTLKARDGAVKDLIDDIDSGNPRKASLQLPNEGGGGEIYIELPRIQIDKEALALGGDPTFEVPFYCLGTWDSGGGTQLTAGNNSFFIQHGDSSSDFGNRA